MSILDIIIVVVAFVGFVLGYKDGFVRKLIGLIGFGLAIYFSITLAFPFGRWIEAITGIEIYLSEIMAGIIIFLAITFLFAILKRFVHPFDRVNNFLNQLTGGIIGAIQILFFLSALFIILNIFQSPAKDTRSNSFFYGKVYNIIPATIDYLSDYAPQPKEVIKDYIRDKDTLQ